MCRSSDYVSIVSDPVTCRKTVKANLAMLQIVGKDTTEFCTVSHNKKRRQLLPQMIQLTSGDLSIDIMALCDSDSSISFMDQSVASTLQARGREASFSVAGIHGSQDVKTEIVSIDVSAQQRNRPLNRVNFYIHKNLKLGKKNVELMELKAKYPHLKNLSDKFFRCGYLVFNSINSTSWFPNFRFL